MPGSWATDFEADSRGSSRRITPEFGDLRNQVTQARRGQPVPYQSFCLLTDVPVATSRLGAYADLLWRSKLALKLRA